MQGSRPKRSNGSFDPAAGVGGRAKYYFDTDFGRGVYWESSRYARRYRVLQRIHRRKEGTLLGAGSLFFLCRLKGISR